MGIQAALELDYVVSSTEKDCYHLERPLDRFLTPIHEILDLKTSIYRVPERCCGLFCFSFEKRIIDTAFIFWFIFMHDQNGVVGKAS